MLNVFCWLDGELIDPGTEELVPFMVQRNFKSKDLLGLDWGHRSKCHFTFQTFKNEFKKRKKTNSFIPNVCLNIADRSSWWGWKRSRRPESSLCVRFLLWFAGEEGRCQSRGSRLELEEGEEEEKEVVQEEQEEQEEEECKTCETTFSPKHLHGCKLDDPLMNTQPTKGNIYYILSICLFFFCLFTFANYIQSRPTAIKGPLMRFFMESFFVLPPRALQPSHLRARMNRSARLRGCLHPTTNKHL